MYHTVYHLKILRVAHSLYFLQVIVKCTLVQALRLCTGRTAHRGSRGIALPIHDQGTKRWWGQRHAPAALYPGKELVIIVQEAGWAPGPVWTGAENLALTGIRSPGRPARGQSLYRLRPTVLVIHFIETSIDYFPGQNYLICFYNQNGVFTARYGMDL